MIDDILDLIAKKDFTSVMTEVKNHKVNTIDIVNKLIYMNRLSDLKWFYLEMKIYGYIRI